MSLQSIQHHDVTVPIAVHKTGALFRERGWLDCRDRSPGVRAYLRFEVFTEVRTHLGLCTQYFTSTLLFQLNFSSVQCLTCLIPPCTFAQCNAFFTGQRQTFPVFDQICWETQRQITTSGVSTLRKLVKGLETPIVRDSLLTPFLLHPSNLLNLFHLYPEFLRKIGTHLPEYHRRP
jgi:hypothetical protein